MQQARYFFAHQFFQHVFVSKNFSKWQCLHRCNCHCFLISILYGLHFKLCCHQKALLGRLQCSSSLSRALTKQKPRITRESGHHCKILAKPLRVFGCNFAPATRCLLFISQMSGSLEVILFWWTPLSFSFLSLHAPFFSLYSVRLQHFSLFQFLEGE